MEITKREILSSITIISIMLVIGLLISSKISDYQLDKNARYNKALKIESKELFQYSMDTNVGNAFVYGELEAIDKVKFPEINKECLYIVKIKEKYTMHTRTVTTTVNGKTRTKTETYWTWDEIGREQLKSKKVKFCDIEFNTSQFNISANDYIDTIQPNSHIKYKYYGYPIKSKGTIFTNINNKNIGENIPFYRNKNIDETTEDLTSNIGTYIFWIIWIILIVIILYLFFDSDNNWLD